VRPALANVRPDIVINAAAYTAVDQAEKEPEMDHGSQREGGVGGC
jgi:dTDP-4-dehydrorhamnose reductase